MHNVRYLNDLMRNHFPRKENIRTDKRTRVISPSHQVLKYCPLISTEMAITEQLSCADILFRVIFVNEPPHDRYYSTFQFGFVLIFSVFVDSTHKSIIFEGKLSSVHVGFLSSLKMSFFLLFLAVSGSSIQFEPSFIIFDRSKGLLSCKISAVEGHLVSKLIFITEISESSYLLDRFLLETLRLFQLNS